MKRFRRLLAAILAVMLFASAAWAETVDLTSLLDDSQVPKSTSINYDIAVTGENHTSTADFVNGSGDILHVEAVFVTSLTVDDWSSVDEWLKDTARAAIQNNAADTEVLAKAIDSAIQTARADASGGTDVWAQSEFALSMLTVTYPYYMELSLGVNGEATKTLQQKLILLGYLTGSADGYFGEMTQTAVKELESYVRLLEQDEIDAQGVTAEPTAAPTDVIDVPITETGVTPATEVDGVAEPILLAYLYSDSFKVTRGDLASGDSGDAVLRLQRRLSALGYLVGTPDGSYGGDTARAVRIFQAYNNLDQTGKADVATQELLFSENAVSPENPILAEGSTGDAVKTLQLRLRVLGFSSGSVDGDYGSATVTGVKALQQYMRDLEEQEIRADAAKMAELEASGADISTLLTVEVNGVADPMLLEDFYSDSFPAIPSAMKSGDSGADVVRLQRRLSTLEYYYGSCDGEYGDGTETAVRDFQKRNGLTQDGVAGTATLTLLFSADAQKALKPYLLKVSTDDQRVYVYALDDNAEYTRLVKTMVCSTGRDATPTPTGTYTSTTGPGARWHYFKKYDCWAQYAYYIEGDILFHSVLYNEKEGKVTQSSVNNLGRKASHGCVRLSVEDAKWIYENCPAKTTVIVY